MARKKRITKISDNELRRELAACLQTMLTDKRSLKPHRVAANIIDEMVARGMGFDKLVKLRSLITDMELLALRWDNSLAHERATVIDRAPGPQIGVGGDDD